MNFSSALLVSFCFWFHNILWPAPTLSEPIHCFSGETDWLSIPRLSENPSHEFSSLGNQFSPDPTQARKDHSEPPNQVRIKSLKILEGLENNPLTGWRTIVHLSVPYSSTPVTSDLALNSQAESFWFRLPQPTCKRLARPRMARSWICGQHLDHRLSPSHPTEMVLFPKPTAAPKSHHSSHQRTALKMTMKDGPMTQSCLGHLMLSFQKGASPLNPEKTHRKRGVNWPERLLRNY